MNKFLFLVIYITPIFIFSQIDDVAGNEKYNFYSKRIFYDNTLQELIPLNIMEEYYLKLDNKDFKTKQIFDKNNKNRSLFITTKKAGKGFLHINKTLMEYLSKEKEVIIDYKLTYFFRSNEVKTYKQIQKLIRLKKVRKVIIYINNDSKEVKMIIDNG